MGEQLTGEVIVEKWPLKDAFVISRSARTHVDVVYLRLSDGLVQGQGECQPNARYNETTTEVQAVLQACFPASFSDLQQKVKNLPSMAARNALDCALLDYQAKRDGKTVAALLGVEEPKTIRTVFTLSVNTPEKMAEKAIWAASIGRKHLKLKLAGGGDLERLIAVREAVPGATLVADANEAWTPQQLVEWMPALQEQRLALLEQPLADSHDEALRDIEHLVPVCADESCHTAEDVAELVGKYDYLNIKLDKTGGLTPALELMRAAEAHKLGVMVGCMLGTSLAMAPAMIVASKADFVDIDGPLLLAKDRAVTLGISDDLMVAPPPKKLWG